MHYKVTYYYYYYYHMTNCRRRTLSDIISILIIIIMLSVPRHEPFSLVDLVSRALLNLNFIDSARHSIMRRVIVVWFYYGRDKNLIDKSSLSSHGYNYFERLNGTWPSVLVESGVDENYSVMKLIGGVDSFISCYYIVSANYIVLMPAFFWSI